MKKSYEAHAADIKTEAKRVRDLCHETTLEEVVEKVRNNLVRDALHPPSRVTCYNEPIILKLINVSHQVPQQYRKNFIEDML